MKTSDTAQRVISREKEEVGMSTAPLLEADDIGPIEWVNELTFIAQSGGNRGLEEGDRIFVRINSEDMEVEVTRVAGEKVVFERVSSGLGHYGKSSVGEIVRS